MDGSQHVRDGSKMLAVEIIDVKLDCDELQRTSVRNDDAHRYAVIFNHLSGHFITR